METEQKLVKLGNTGEIETDSIDISNYIGKKAKIENVEEYSGQFGYYIKLQTVPIETLNFGDKSITIRATKIFGLQQNKDGQIGWSKESKLSAFLHKMKVEHYNDLISKEVVIQAMPNKTGQEFLTFN